MTARCTEHRPRVGGLVGFSTLDYPGRLSSVVFVQGCAWRCGYCHNPHLQGRGEPRIEWSSVRTAIARRTGLIDAVVFSGGEPTGDAALPEAIHELRALGFAIGLHSAGLYPRRLAGILRHVDWVGLDVKAPFDDYAAVTGVAGSAARARASVEVVLASGCDYELRTTFHPGLVTERGVLSLAQWLSRRGARRFALQEFRAQGCGNETLRAGARRASEALLDQLAALFPHFVHREAA